MEAECQMSAEASAGQQGMSVAPMRDAGICPPQGVGQALAQYALMTNRAV